MKFEVIAEYSPDNNSIKMNDITDELKQELSKELDFILQEAEERAEEARAEHINYEWMELMDKHGLPSNEELLEKMKKDLEF